MKLYLSLENKNDPRASGISLEMKMYAGLLQIEAIDLKDKKPLG